MNAHGRVLRVRHGVLIGGVAPGFLATSWSLSQVPAARIAVPAMAVIRPRLRRFPQFLTLSLAGGAAPSMPGPLQKSVLGM